MKHQHDYTRAILQEQRLMLACSCGYTHARPIVEHEWVKPGRPLAHARAVKCTCCRITLLHVRRYCRSCRRSRAHLVRVRPRARHGLALTCRSCHRRESSARDIAVEVSRRASREYQRRKRAGTL